MRWAELGLALFAGCVIGWWWGERPQIMAEINIVTVLTSIGTVLTGVGAVYLAWRHQRLYDLEKQNRARSYVRAQHVILQIMVRESVGLCCKVGATGPNAHHGYNQELWDDVHAFSREFGALDLESFSIVDEKSVEEFRSISTSLVTTLKELEHGPGRRCTAAMSKVEKGLKALSEIALNA